MALRNALVAGLLACIFVSIFASDEDYNKVHGKVKELLKKADKE